MAQPFHALMRRLFAALLVAGLVSGGLGHGAEAYARAARATVTIAGIAVTLCQTDGGGDTGQGSVHHDCDQCLMRLAAVLAGPQPVPAPVLFVLATEQRPAVPQRLAGDPARSAHRARGPPAA